MSRKSVEGVQRAVRVRTSIVLQNKLSALRKPFMFFHLWKLLSSQREYRPHGHGIGLTCPASPSEGCLICLSTVLKGNVGLRVRQIWPLPPTRCTYFWACTALELHRSEDGTCYMNVQKVIPRQSIRQLRQG